MFFWIGAPHRIDELKSIGRDITSAELRQIPILVIDDEAFPYLDTLRNHDFNIRQVTDIQDLESVASYAIVLCDIRGVGRAFGSQFEGAHVISEIRKRFPEKVVIAYTGQQFDASYNEHLRRSDFVLKKDADSDEWLATLDSAVKLVVDPIKQWRRFRDYLLIRDVPLFDVLLLQNDYVSAFIRGSTTRFPGQATVKRLPDDVRGVLQSFTGSALFKMLLG